MVSRLRRLWLKRLYGADEAERLLSMDPADRKIRQRALRTYGAAQVDKGMDLIKHGDITEELRITDLEAAIVRQELRDLTSDPHSFDAAAVANAEIRLRALEERKEDLNVQRRQLGMKLAPEWSKTIQQSVQGVLADITELQPDPRWQQAADIVERAAKGEIAHKQSRPESKHVLRSFAYLGYMLDASRDLQEKFELEPKAWHYDQRQAWVQLNNRHCTVTFGINRSRRRFSIGIRMRNSDTQISLLQLVSGDRSASDRVADLMWVEMRDCWFGLKPPDPVKYTAKLRELCNLLASFGRPYLTGETTVPASPTAPS